MLPPRLLTCISSRLLRPPFTLLSSSHRWNQCRSFSLWTSLGLTYIKMLKKRIKLVLALFLLLSTLSEFLGSEAVQALPRSSSPVLLKPAVWVLILYHLWNAFLTQSIHLSLNLLPLLHWKVVATFPPFSLPKASTLWLSARPPAPLWLSLSVVFAVCLFFHLPVLSVLIFLAQKLCLFLSSSIFVPPKPYSVPLSAFTYQ